MKVEPLSPVGARVTDLDLADAPALTDEVVRRLVDLLAEHGVLVMPAQHLDVT